MELEHSNLFGVSSLLVFSTVKYKSLLYNEVLAYFSAEMCISICQNYTLFCYLHLVANLFLISYWDFLLLRIPRSFCDICKFFSTYT